jgi:hypothetical protein
MFVIEGRFAVISDYSLTPFERVSLAIERPQDLSRLWLIEMGRSASHLPTRRRVRRMLHALVLSRTWAFRSRSPRLSSAQSVAELERPAVWKWLSQRIGTSAACSPVTAVLHPAGIITTKADRQSARRRCCSFNSDLLAGQFVEPLSDRGGVIDD